MPLFFDGSSTKNHLGRAYREPPRMPLQRVTEGMRTKGHGRTLVFTKDKRTCYPHETSSTLTQVVTQDARTGYPHETSSISFIHQRPSIKHHRSGITSYTNDYLGRCIYCPSQSCQNTRDQLNSDQRGPPPRPKRIDDSY